MSTLRERILSESNGSYMLDRYLLGQHVCAITCDPRDADTCIIGDSHIGTSEHVCLKEVGLDEEISDDCRILMITKSTWKKSLTENLLKTTLEEYKRQQD